MKNLTTAETIWNEIKDIDLGLFSLPDQPVSKYCSPVTVEPSKLYITLSVNSALPVLVDTLKNYELEQAGRFITVVKKNV